MSGIYLDEEEGKDVRKVLRFVFGADPCLPANVLNGVLGVGSGL